MKTQITPEFLAQAEAIKPGDQFEFTPTGKVFQIAKVGTVNVSWHTGHTIKSYHNRIEMTTLSKKRFASGLQDGTYKPV